MESEVVVYVVLEDDRVEGPNIAVVGVYRSREDADRAVGGSSNCWVVEKVLQ